MANTRTSAGRALRRIPSKAVLVGLGLVAVATIVAAVLSWWPIAISGLALLQLGTVLCVLGPWSSPRKKPTKLAREIQELERRVDALGSRLVASTERTRVELLDALAQRSDDLEDRPS